MLNDASSSIASRAELIRIGADTNAPERFAVIYREGLMGNDSIRRKSGNI